MANSEHREFFFGQGVQAWNAWRVENPEITPDFSGEQLLGSDFSGANLSRANLWGAHLYKANLSGANLLEADLSEGYLIAANFSGANLRGAHLREAHLRTANLSGADLREADLTYADLMGVNLTCANMTRTRLPAANLSGANLSGADLTDADLDGVALVEANLEKANLTGCSIYGLSAWNVKLEGAKQLNLVITRQGEAVIQVDNLEVAQFIYLLLNNKKIREVIDTITSKVVLILGRFTPSRKAILDRLREKLRADNYLPILFDFEKPASRTTVETITTLAHMSRFVVADLTDAKSVLQELQAIVPSSPSVPVQPLLLASQEEPGMFDFLRSFPSVLEPVLYQHEIDLLASLLEKIVTPAEARALQLSKQKNP